jgi:hypothetical protein
VGDSDRKDVLLVPSGDKSDGGFLIGRDPREVPSEILSLYYREKNPLKALRARCLDCCCGQASEVRKCTAVDCPSWPFRMGVNPFRAKREIPEDQRQAMAARLRGQNSSEKI